MESPVRKTVHWLSALVFLCSFLSTHSLNSKVHEHMAAEELRSVFHVEDPSNVPEYHLVHLTHHLARRHIPTQHPKNSIAETQSKTPHEKTNSKRWKTETSPPSLLNDEMFVNAKKYMKDVDIIGDLNTTVDISFDVSNSSESGESSEVNSDVKGDREHLVDGQDEDVHEIELEAFGKPMKLTLKKQEGLFKKEGLKMWKVVENGTQPHGVDYEEMKSETDEEIGELYQDHENEAALLIRRHPKHGKLLVEGSIGHELVIRPVPDSVSVADDDEMFMDATSMADMVSIDTGLPIVRRQRTDRERIRRALNGANHVIIKRDPASGDHLQDYAFMEPDHISKRFRTKRSIGSRKKRDAPYVIYPEILVIVDYDGYRLHGGDNVQIKRYFVSFWNGVDLRYKLLKGPRIRISIAGIIISRGRDATPYLERNRVGRDAIDSAAALTDMGKYLFRERRLPVYDIAVAITKYDMCRRRKGGRCTKGTAGFAYVGGACVVNKRLEKVNSVAIIEDTGGFSGIIVAAHEVGHLLGAVHDGSPPPSYLGGPGAEKCRWEDGFIMSDLRHTEKGFRWSPCSVQSFHHFLNGDTATCLYNSPHEDDSLPRVLPGRLLTLDAQCRKDRGTSACFKDDRVCAQLFCFDAASGYCVAYRPAAEGSPCGDGQYCINGRCITEHENIIPDYSQHTPSYVRPDGSSFFGNITSYEASTEPFMPSSQSDYKNYYNNQQDVYNQGQDVYKNQDNYNQHQNLYNQNPEVHQKPEVFYQQPERFSFKPDMYSPRSDIISKSPEVFTRKPEQYSSKAVYSQKPETYTKRPDVYANSIAPTHPSVRTESVFNYYLSSTTQKPFEYKFPTRPTSTPSRASFPPSINKYSITSTKSPYDFRDFTTKKPYEISSSIKQQYDSNNQVYTKNINNYSEYTTKKLFDFKSFTTTKSPYNFAGFTRSTEPPKKGFYSKEEFDNYFSRSTKSPYQNKVKNLYKFGTQYQGKSSDNSIRPDASQQVVVEPARLVFSYRRNLTTGEIIE